MLIHLFLPLPKDHLLAVLDHIYKETSVAEATCKKLFSVCFTIYIRIVPQGKSYVVKFAVHHSTRFHHRTNYLSIKKQINRKTIFKCTIIRIVASLEIQQKISMKKVNVCLEIVTLLMLIYCASTASIRSEKVILEEHGVTTLNDTSFQTITSIDRKNPDKPLSSETQWLVLYYANWCGHCQRFINETFQFIAPELEKLEFKVTPAAIECPSNPLTCADFMIPAYPTLFYFRSDGRKEEYPTRGSRTVQDVIAFAQASHAGKEFVSMKPSQRVAKTSVAPDATSPPTQSPSPDAIKQTTNNGDNDNILKVSKTEPMDSDNFAKEIKLPGLDRSFNKESVTVSPKGITLKGHQFGSAILEKENIFFSPIKKLIFGSIVAISLLAIILTKWCDDKKYEDEGLNMDSDDIGEEQNCVMDLEENSPSIPRKKIFDGEKVKQGHGQSSNERQRFVQFEEYHEQKQEQAINKIQEPDNLKDETPKSSFEDLNEEEIFEELEQSLGK